MWPSLRHAPASSCRQFCPRALRAAALTRAASSASSAKPPTSELLKKKTPVAKDLAATGVWDSQAKKSRARKATSSTSSTAKSTTATATEKTTKTTKTTKKKSKKNDAFDSRPNPTGDKARVNVASEKLCDDIAEYIGPTLERHVGCDILDINPGAGLWSSKLHDVLKPRSHILMEPDADLYKPFLEKLLEKPGTRLVPKSGILWKELTDAMGYLEHQTAQQPQQQQKQQDADPSPPTRNNTLLVTANLASYPKRRYRMFDSVAILVLYQLLTSVRFGSLFQKYGLVRMLLWVNDDDKRTFIPRSVQNRKKSALQAEFACEHLAEVAGKDPASLQVAAEQLRKLYFRDQWINVASTRDALARMREGGIQEPPTHRRMALTSEVMKLEEKEMKEQKGKKKNGKGEGEGSEAEADATAETHSHTNRPYLAELEALDKAYEAGELIEKSKEWTRRAKLRSAVKQHDKEALKHDELLRELEELTRQRAEVDALKAAYGITDEEDGDLAVGKTTGAVSVSGFDDHPPPPCEQGEPVKAEAEAEAGAKATTQQLEELRARLADLEVRETAYNTKVQSLTKNVAIDFRVHRDNAHLYRQSPPAMLWDRRPWEPLRVEPDEFFPNVECALLDVQPKAMHHLLRDVGRRSKTSSGSAAAGGGGGGGGGGGAGDMFDLIQRSMLFTSLEPVGSALEKLWPGAREGVLPYCPSLRDPKQGGRPGEGHLSICPRVMNERQWTEVLEGFVKWPFRPTYAELVGRLGDDIEMPESGDAAKGSNADF